MTYSYIFHGAYLSYHVNLAKYILHVMQQTWKVYKSLYDSAQGNFTQVME